MAAPESLHRTTIHQCHLPFAHPPDPAPRQVKLRGMRVELGEVEHALSELPGVDLAVALVRSDPSGAQRLVAYVTPASVNTTEAIAAVRPRLPAHMVPSVVVPLQRMPLLPNGKIDRKVGRCLISRKLQP